MTAVFVTAEPAELRVGLRFRLVRAIIGKIARPVLGKHPAKEAVHQAFYVLEKRALSDLVVLDLICEQHDLPRPLQPLQAPTTLEPRRFGFLQRRKPWFRTATAERLISRRLRRLLTRPEATADEATADEASTDEPVVEPVDPVQLIPVLVQWGRAPNREGSPVAVAVERRLVGNVEAAATAESAFQPPRHRCDLRSSNAGPECPTDTKASAKKPTNEPDPPQGERPLTRDTPGIGTIPHTQPVAEPATQALLPVVKALQQQLSDLRLEVVGPDFSHRRTLALEVATSTPVRETFAAELAAQAAKAGIQSGTRAHGRLVAKLQRRVRKNIDAIVSNMTYSTMMVLERLLGWFWNRIYNGVELRGLNALQKLPEGHQLIYVPSHRSHVDYLLLSYLLFQHGRVIPHIVAGDNLDLPVVGGILRRGGAFFMRRSFRDDPLYGAVFSEYLYVMYRRGHSVEFFPEGGRSRTGRLLPARLGLLKMTLDHHRRGLPRPVTLVPVYFGYEKLIEGKSYLEQLRGEKKQRESLFGVFRNLQLTRQNFGHVIVNIGQPIHLDNWVAEHRQAPIEQRPAALGKAVMTAINGAAVLNAVNLIALVMLATNRLAIERALLAEQIDLYLTLLRQDPREHSYALPEFDGEQAIDDAVALDMLHLESTDTGSVASCDSQQAILLTWYRNNVAHCLSIAALMAALVFRRRRPLRRGVLLHMLRILHPYLADELSFEPARGSYERWLQRLLAIGLIEQESGSDRLRAPAQGSAAWYRLKLLAQVVMQSLERMFIVVALLQQQQAEGIDRATLKDRSQTVARKLSRLYGLNAPEFFDGGLFNQFIDALVDRGQVAVDDSDQLRAGRAIKDVLRNAGSVIDADILQAILRTGAATAVSAPQAAA